MNLVSGTLPDETYCTYLTKKGSMVESGKGREIKRDLLSFAERAESRLHQKTNAHVKNNHYECKGKEEGTTVCSN